MADDESDPRVGKKEADDTQTRVGKFVCPMAYVNVFTPMEFEEVSWACSFFTLTQPGVGVVGWKLTPSLTAIVVLEYDTRYDILHEHAVSFLSK